MCALIALVPLFAAAASALPQPLAEGSTHLEHPVFISPHKIPSEAFGAPLEVILLDSSELTTAPLPPVVGSEGDGLPIPTLQARTLKDERYHQTKKGYPWDYIGTLVSTSGTHCTASLVGPRHVATARHCVNQPRDANASFVFSPHYDQGTNGYTTSSVPNAFYLPEVTTPDGCWLADDWAILILDERLGDKYGWFGLIPFSKYKADQPLFSHLGYPGDLGKTEVPYQQDGITGSRYQSCNSFESGAPISTNIFLAKGHSGGPLWYRTDIGQHWLYGVASAATDTESAFAGGKTFIQNVLKLIKEYP